MLYITVSKTYTELLKTIRLHLAVIGKRATNVQGESFFVDLTTSSKEDKIFYDLIDAGAETIVSEISDVCSNYYEEDGVKFVVYNDRWEKGDETYVGDLKNALDAAIGRYLVNFGLAQFLSSIFPAVSNKSVPMYGETYIEHCQVILKNIKTLAFLKRPAPNSGTTYQEMLNANDEYWEDGKIISLLTIKRNGTPLCAYNGTADKTIDIIVPTKVSELENDKKYITGIDSDMVVEALGYTPFDKADFTQATVKSTLGIYDWALAEKKPSYAYSEITGLVTVLDSKYDSANFSTDFATELSKYQLGHKVAASGSGTYVTSLYESGDTIYYQLADFEANVKTIVNSMSGGFGTKVSWGEQGDTSVYLNVDGTEKRLQLAGDYLTKESFETYFAENWFYKYKVSDATYYTETDEEVIAGTKVAGDVKTEAVYAIGTNFDLFSMKGISAFGYGASESGEGVSKFSLLTDVIEAGTPEANQAWGVISVGETTGVPTYGWITTGCNVSWGEENCGIVPLTVNGVTYDLYTGLFAFDSYHDNICLINPASTSRYSSSISLGMFADNIHIGIPTNEAGKITIGVGTREKGDIDFSNGSIEISNDEIKINQFTQFYGRVNIYENVSLRKKATIREGLYYTSNDSVVFRCEGTVISTPNATDIKLRTSSTQNITMSEDETKLVGNVYFKDAVVRIGNAVLIWDSGNNALKLCKYDSETGAVTDDAMNFFATGGVSAYGYGASEEPTGASYFKDLLDVTPATTSEVGKAWGVVSVENDTPTYGWITAGGESTDYSVTGSSVEGNTLKLIQSGNSASPVSVLTWGAGIDYADTSGLCIDKNYLKDYFYLRTDTVANATYATTAGSADTAGYATTAGSADTAGYATSAGSLVAGAPTAWGQRYFEQGLPTSISGDMTDIGNATPKTTNTYNLGSSSLKWANVYATTFHGNLDGNASGLTSSALSNLFWANLNLASSANTSTKPQFGSVGIGTAATYPLDVNGKSYLRGSVGIWTAPTDGYALALGGALYAPSRVYFNNEECWIDGSGNIFIKDNTHNWNLFCGDMSKPMLRAAYGDSARVGIGCYPDTSYNLDVSGNGRFTDFVKIGKARLRYDSENNALYIEGESDGSTCNFYATGGVSAYSGIGSYETLANLTLSEALYLGSTKECSFRYVSEDGLYISSSESIYFNGGSYFDSDGDLHFANGWLNINGATLSYNYDGDFDGNAVNVDKPMRFGSQGFAIRYIEKVSTSQVKIHLLDISGNMYYCTLSLTSE